MVMGKPSFLRSVEQPITDQLSYRSTVFSVTRLSRRGRLRGSRLGCLDRSLNRRSWGNRLLRDNSLLFARVGCSRGTVLSNMFAPMLFSWNIKCPASKSGARRCYALCADVGGQRLRDHYRFKLGGSSSRPHTNHYSKYASSEQRLSPNTPTDFRCRTGYN